MMPSEILVDYEKQKPNLTVKWSPASHGKSLKFILSAVQCLVYEEKIDKIITFEEIWIHDPNCALFVHFFLEFHPAWSLSFAKASVVMLITAQIGENTEIRG